MNWKDRITTDPKVMVGKPVIVGTRITVEFILGRFADGWTEKQILDNYPRLTPDDLRLLLHVQHGAEFTGRFTVISCKKFRQRDL